MNIQPQLKIYWSLLKEKCIALTPVIERFSRTQWTIAV